MFGILTYKHPVNLVVFANIAAYLVLFLYRQPYDYNALLMCLLTVGLICAVYYIIVWQKMGDGYIFLIVSMLFSLGLIMIYRLDPKLGQKQLVWFVIGLAFFFASQLLFIKIRKLDRFGLLFAAGTFILNIATLIFGKNINGSKSWIVIYGHSFQFSELSKILFIIFLACLINGNDSCLPDIPALKMFKRGTLKNILLMTVTFINMFLMILQREWGTMALLYMLYIVVLYAFGENRRFLVGNMACAIPVGLFGYFFIYHIKVRVDIWLNPWADASGKGYQILQSLFAIGEGSFTGRGLGLGRPDLIPAVKTDFIFSAICEELGIMSGIAVILLYFILFYRGIKISLNTSERFYKVISLGISVMFGIQTFIIIGGVIKLIPLTGITLPFISYGGSSLVSSFILLGILQAVSAVRNDGPAAMLSSYSENRPEPGAERNEGETDG